MDREIIKYGPPPFIFPFVTMALNERAVITVVEKDTAKIRHVNTIPAYLK
jgi:hypothetical protein